MINKFDINAVAPEINKTFRELVHFARTRGLPYYSIAVTILRPKVDSDKIDFVYYDGFNLLSRLNNAHLGKTVNQHAMPIIAVKYLVIPLLSPNGESCVHEVPMEFSILTSLASNP